jgi:hypothetical protein
VVYGLLSVGQSVSRWYDPRGKIPPTELADRLSDMLLFGLVTRSDSASSLSGESDTPGADAFIGRPDQK